MKARVTMMAILLIFFSGLISCSTIVPGKIVYSDKLEGTIEDLRDRGVDVKVAILVSDNGELLFYDTAGKHLKKCVLPKPSDKSKADQTQAALKRKPAKGVCKGLTTGSAVTRLQTLPVVKSNSGNCMTFGPNASGLTYEFCW